MSFNLSGFSDVNNIENKKIDPSIKTGKSLNVNQVTQTSISNLNNVLGVEDRKNLLTKGETFENQKVFDTLQGQQTQLNDEFKTMAVDNVRNVLQDKGINASESDINEFVQSAYNSGNKESVFKAVTNTLEFNEIKSLAKDNSLNIANLIKNKADSINSLSSNNNVAAPSSSFTDMYSAGFDFDLIPFTSDEIMANPSMCAMGGASNCDRAKPEMQQNLKECKMIKLALSDMASEDSGNYPLSMALGRLGELEQIIRGCLKRGQKAADSAYKAQGVNPEDEQAVSDFVAKIGKEVLEIGKKHGLEIEVSEDRAQRLKDGGQRDLAGFEKSKSDKTRSAFENNKTSTGSSLSQSSSAGSSSDEEVLEIKTKKTEKNQEIEPEEVENNPVLFDSIMEQLTALWDEKQSNPANFNIPNAVDLGATTKDSPLDRSITDVNDKEKQTAQENTAPAQLAVNAPVQKTGGIQFSRKSASGDIKELMKNLGMQGQKFNVKVQVYEPNAQVELSKGSAGIKVNSGLQGKEVSVKKPKLVARDENGELYKIGDLQKLDGNSTFIAKIKGVASGNEPASKGFFSKGAGAISIPGTKAA